MTMDDILDRLMRQHPEAAPIVRSKYIRDCHVGRGRVWRAGHPVVTDTYQLYPTGVFPAVYSRLQLPEDNSSSRDLPWTARVWSAASSFTIFTVGMTAKFITSFLNTTVIHGKEHLDAALTRPLNQPLLTVQNHNSCFDDPGLMGAMLSTQQLADRKGMRWSCSAAEVIFSNRLFSAFFALGKVIPVVRGWGARQPGIDFLIDRLQEGSWVNIFPEARVVDAHGACHRFRWGIGRMVLESKICPVILPIYHMGMNTVLPNPKSDEESQSYRIRLGNLVTICIGKAIDLSGVVESVKAGGSCEQAAWAEITRRVQDIVLDLEKTTKSRHLENIINWIKRWHDSRDLTFYLLT